MHIHEKVYEREENCCCGLFAALKANKPVRSVYSTSKRGLGSQVEMELANI